MICQATVSQEDAPGFHTRNDQPQAPREVISQFMEALLWLHSNPPKKKMENCFQDVIKVVTSYFQVSHFFYLSWGILTDPRKKRNIQSVNK